MEQKTSLQSWLLLVVISVIWGSSFILMKKGLVAFSPQQVASLRLFIASLVLIPYALTHLKYLTKENVVYIILVGYIGTAIPPFLFTKAQTVINSSTAGMLNSLTPLFALLLGYWFFHTQLNRYKMMGVMLGFAGAVILFVFKAGSELTINRHAMLVMLAALCYATASNLLKAKLQGIRPLQLTSYMFLFIGPPAGLHLFFSDLPAAFDQHPLAWQSFGYICILALVGTALAYLLFNTLIQKSTAIFAQSVTYLMPVVAIFWGLLDGEELLTKDYIGSACILAGIYLININVVAAAGSVKPSKDPG